jgi:hypothetical protein
LRVLGVQSGALPFLAGGATTSPCEMKSLTQ